MVILIFSSGVRIILTYLSDSSHTFGRFPLDNFDFPFPQCRSWGTRGGRCTLLTATINLKAPLKIFQLSGLKVILGATMGAYFLSALR